MMNPRRIANFKDDIPLTGIEDVRFPAVVEQPVYAHGTLNATHAKVRIPEYKALVNPQTGFVYSVNSDAYKTVRHEELLGSAIDALHRINEPYALQVLFPNEGRQMWAKIHLMERRYEVRQGDFVRPTIEIFGSYDKSWASRAVFGAFRLVCTNGMVVGAKFGAIRTAHLSVFDTADLIEMVKDSHGVFVAQTGRWAEMQTAYVTPERYERVIADLRLPVAQLRSLEAEVEVSSMKMIEDLKYRTLSELDFLNLITQNLTHDRAMVRNRRRQAETFQRLRGLF